MADEDQITLTLEGAPGARGRQPRGLRLVYQSLPAGASVPLPVCADVRPEEVRPAACRRGTRHELPAGRVPQGERDCRLGAWASAGRRRSHGRTPPTLAWENLAGLLDAIDREDLLDVSITSELDAALKALGRQPRISVDVVRAGSRRQHEVTEERIARIRSKSEEVRDVDTELTVTGVLHAIDLEPDKVAIRTPSGVDWTCEYQPALEREVLGLIGHRVLAAGRGHATSPRAGTLQLDKIRALPEPEQTQLFTGPVVPLEALKEEQGITRPQGNQRVRGPELGGHRGERGLLARSPRRAAVNGSAAEPETIVCDTSFVGVQRTCRRREAELASGARRPTRRSRPCHLGD